MSAQAASPDLRASVDGRQWYHTLDLPGGIVTPGWFDLRSLAQRLPFPASMAGMRCLDIGTFEGFWALQMEARGAREVIGIDILDPLAWDWPFGSEAALVDDLEERKRGGAGFELVKEVLGSAIERVELSIYDLTPERVGTFDFIYLGSLLLHLRDPVGALKAVRSVCRGRLLSVDAIDLPLSLLTRRPVCYLDAVGRPWWWRPNQAAIGRMLQASGFRPARAPQRVFMSPGPQAPRPRRPRAVARAARSRTGRELLFASMFGSPHLASLTEPTPVVAGATV